MNERTISKITTPWPQTLSREKEVGSAKRNAIVEFTVPFSDLDPMGVVWHGKKKCHSRIYRAIF